MKTSNRMSILGVIVLLAVLVVPQVGYAAETTNVAAAVAGKTSSTSSHVMVFQVSSGGKIYAVDPSGKNLRYLTTGMDPALSPDGKQVAFTRWDGQGNGASGSLWVINIDGTGERMVTSSANQPKSPTWSPDGTRIIISIQQEGKLYDSYTCIINGKPVDVVTPPAGANCRRLRPRIPGGACAWSTWRPGPMWTCPATRTPLRRPGTRPTPGTWSSGGTRGWKTWT